MITAVKNGPQSTRGVMMTGNGYVEREGEGACFSTTGSKGYTNVRQFGARNMSVRLKLVF